MPLWTIYHTADTFTTPEERSSFAQTITSAYGLLPPFYVIVTFHPLDPTSIYRSGKPLSTPFVRLVIHHLARHASDHPEGPAAGYERARKLVEGAVKEHVKDKGYGFEFTVSEEPRELWVIDGVVPPPFGGEVFEKWRREDMVSEY